MSWEPFGDLAENGPRTLVMGIRGTPVGVTAPVAGDVLVFSNGQWVPSSTAALSRWQGAQQTSSNNIISTGLNTWSALSNATWVAQNAATDFAVNLSTGVFTYTGPTIQALIVLAATVTVEAGNNVPALTEWVVDQNAALIGTTTSPSQSQLLHVTVLDQQNIISLVQMATLATGATLRFIGRNRSVNQNINGVNVNWCVKQL